MIITSPGDTKVWLTRYKSW